MRALTLTMIIVLLAAIAAVAIVVAGIEAPRARHVQPAGLRNR